MRALLTLVVVVLHSHCAVSTFNATNTFDGGNCLGENVVSSLTSICTGENVCTIIHKAPTWAERTKNLCPQGAVPTDLPKGTVLNCPSAEVNKTEPKFSVLFPCNAFARLGFEGVVFDFAYDFLPATDVINNMTCIFTDYCSFNEVAQIVADRSSTNPTGLGHEAPLVYAGFLLWSRFRGTNLSLISSTPFATSRVVLVGMGDGAREWTPIDSIKAIVSSEVWYWLGVFFLLWVVVAFLLGGDDDTLPKKPADRWNEVVGLSWRRFWSIRFTPHPSTEVQGTWNRLVVYMAFTRIAMLALAGVLLLFESILLIAPPTSNNLGQSLRDAIKEGKVSLVNNTALKEGVELYFDDIRDKFDVCPTFQDCTERVAKKDGSYLISHETVAYSPYNDGVVVFETTENLDFFEGVFFYSSAMPQAFQAYLNEELYDAKLSSFFEESVERHSAKPGDNSPVFNWRLLALGFGIPVAVVAGMAVSLLSLCLVWELLRFVVKGGTNHHDDDEKASLHRSIANTAVGDIDSSEMGEESCLQSLTRKSLTPFARMSGRADRTDLDHQPPIPRRVPSDVVGNDFESGMGEEASLTTTFHAGNAVEVRGLPQEDNLENDAFSTSIVHSDTNKIIRVEKFVVTM